MINVLALVGTIQSSQMVQQQFYIYVKVENNLYEEKREDIFKVKVWKGIYKDIAPQSILKDNFIIGIKGRLEVENQEMIVVAEKVTHLGKIEN